jgi:O-antigen ligase
MNRVIFHKKAHLFLAILIAFWLPLARLVPIFIALLLLNWLAEADYRNKMKSVFKNKLAIVFILFYLLHLFGLFYTSNMDSGLFDIQVKLSLFVFPLVIASRPFSKPESNKIFYAFVAGAFVSSLIMLVRAVITYILTGENNFYYQAFSSFILHPSYMSMYLNLAIFWIIIEGFKGETQVVKQQKYAAIFLITFFIFIIILLSSKLGLATLLLLFVLLIIRYIVSHKKYIIGLSALFSIIIAGYSIYAFVPEIRDRVKTALEVVSSNNVDKSNGESTAVRILVWGAANNVIADNFLLGTGTGDSKDELMKEYKKQEITGAYEHELNAHNEYYQVFVSLGIIGFTVFLLSLFLPLIKSLKKKYIIYGLFLCIMLLNFLTESMFETQAGVMFYAFFNSLLCFSYNENKPLL